MTGGDLEARRANKRGQHSGGLDHSEGGADANSRTRTERQILIAGPRCLLLWREAGWVEAVGIGPQQPMAMDDKHRNDHEIACCKLFAAELQIACCDTREHEIGG